jgi:methyltransferase (TIGR00027 family)
MHHSRSSSTARLIARCILLAARDPSLRALVPVDAEAALAAMLEADGGNRCFKYALRHAWTRASLRILERTILPGIIVHFLARKRWIEHAVAAAHANGCNQFVIIGAGLDTLALRLHRAWPNVSFWELDHPASQHPKAVAFKALAPAENLFLVPLDLRNELPSDVLGRHPQFNRHSHTCFIAEGLLMYLPENRVIQLLRDVAQYQPAKIVFTFMEPDSDGHAIFRGGSPAIEKWLHWRREPFAWAIPRERLADFATPLGLQVRSIAGARELRAEFLSPAGLASLALAEGEYLAVLTSTT